MEEDRSENDCVQRVKGEAVYLLVCSCSASLHVPACQHSIISEKN